MWRRLQARGGKKNEELFRPSYGLLRLSVGGVAGGSEENRVELRGIKGDEVVNV